MKSRKPLAVFALPLVAAFGAAFLTAGCASVSSAVIPGERFIPLTKSGSVYSIGQIVEMNSSRVDIVYDSRLGADQTVSDPDELPSVTGKSIASKYTALAKDAMSGSGAKLGDVKVTVAFRDTVARSIPTYSLYKHIQDQMTKNAELRSMILNYAAVGARFEVVSSTVHARLVLSVTDATGKGLVLDPAVLNAVAKALDAKFSLDDAAAAYVSEPVEVGLYADRRMVRALTSAAETEAPVQAKAAK